MAEVRNEDIRKIQLEQIKLIKTFKEICDKEHLQYFMIGGTMLGAIRHKGFIPWDDDADFAMPREDYEKLLSVAPAYLQEPFRLENFIFDNSYLLYFSRISTSRMKVEFPGTEKIQTYNVWIDIFPWDGMPDNRILFNLRQLKIFAKRVLYHYSVFDEVAVLDKKRPTIEKIYMFSGRYLKVGKLFNHKKRWRALDRELKKYPTQYSKWFIHGVTGWILHMGYRPNEPYRGPKDIYKKEIFGEGTLYEFEGMQLCGPKDYKAYLAQHFGDDYMTLPPEEERYAHRVRIIEDQDCKE